MADVTGSLDGKPIILDNAATEATLKAILSAIKANGGSTSGASALAGAAGVNSKAVNAANQSLNNLASKAVPGAAAGLTKLAGPIGLVGGVLGDLAEGAVQTGKNLINLGQQALDGKARMSDFFGAFKDLPIIGVVAGLFQSLEKMQEANLDTYRKLTDTGIDFGGSLQTVRKNALSLGLTLDEFASTMKKNSDIFVGLGGSVNKGANAFVNVNKALVNSKVGQQLQAMGYTFEQMTDLTANYIKVSGSGNARTVEQQKQLAEASAAYGKELDLIARLTGKSREDQEKQLAKAAAQAAYNLKVAQMTPEQQKKAADGLAKASAAMGQAGIEAYQGEITGLGPITDEARTAIAIFPEGSKEILNMAKRAKDTSSATDALAENTKGLSRAQIANKKTVEANQTTLMALSVTQDGFAKTIDPVLNSTAELTKAQINSVEANDARISAEKKAQDDLINSEADRAARADASMKKIGESLMAFIQPLLETLQPLMTDMIKGFSDWLGSPAGQAGLKSFGETMANLVKDMADYAKNLFSPEGREKIVNDLAYGFKLLMIELKKAVMPDFLYGEEGAKKDREALAEQKAAYDETAKKSLENQQAQTDADAARAAASKEGMAAALKTKDDAQATIDSLKDKQNLTDEQKKSLKEAKETVDYQNAIIKQSASITQDTAKSIIENADKKKKALEDSKENRANEDKKFEPRSGWSKAGEGAVEGAAIGSFVPGVGTALGAAIGAAAGWMFFEDGTAGKGGLLRDFGSEGSPAMLHNKEAVLTEQQLTNLANGAMLEGSKGSQEGLGQLLLQLNMQTGQLVAATNQMADYQKRLYDKFTFVGNLFQ
jgi:hypothetical protein